MRSDESQRYKRPPYGSWETSTSGTSSTSATRPSQDHQLRHVLPPKPTFRELLSSATRSPNVSGPTVQQWPFTGQQQSFNNRSFRDSMSHRQESASIQDPVFQKMPSSASTSRRQSSAGSPSSSNRRPSYIVGPFGQKIKATRRPTFQEMLAFQPVTKVAEENASQKTDEIISDSKSRIIQDEIPRDPREPELEDAHQKRKLCSKITFHIHNALFMFSGGALLIFAVIYIIKMKYGNDMNIFNIFTPPSKTPFIPCAMIFIAEGGFIMCVVIGAYIGNACENRTSILMCLAALFVIFLVNFGQGATIYVYRLKVLRDTQELFEVNLAEKMVRNYGYDREISKGFDTAQRGLRCCGVYGPDDYISRSQFMIQNKSYNVPNSCCVRNTIDPQEGRIIDQIKCQSKDIFQNEHYRYQKGCMKPLQLWILFQCILFSTISYSYALIQFLTMVVYMNQYLEI